MENHESSITPESEEQYYVMEKEDVESYKEWAKNSVLEISEKAQPAYVLLSETSAVPLVWLLKETWKESRIPNIPQFYRVVVYGPGGGLLGRDIADSQKIESFLQRREVDKNRSILLFDETTSSAGGNDPEILRHIISEGVFIKDKKANNFTLQKTAQLLCQCGAQEVWSYGGSPINYMKHIQKPLVGMPNDLYREGYVKPTIKEKIELSHDDIVFMDSELSGVIQTDPQKRSQSLEWIHDLKRIGGDAGKEIRRLETSD